MFDPKVLLDAILAGGARDPQTSGQQSGGQQQPSAGGLADILKHLGQGQQRNAAPGQDSEQVGSQGGGLGDILGQVLGKAGGAPGAGAGGSIGDILGQVFGQARQGVSEGAGRVDEAIGARQKLDEIVRQVTGGQGTPEAIEKLKRLAADNQLGAGAVIGALGALVLGTKSGRSLATSAAKLGGAVLIGGLAYKAYQNYSLGKPAFGERGGHAAKGPQGLHAAPQGSGFEAEAQSGDQALLYVRTMIAAAAADGQIDAGEQQQILGGLKQLGLDAEATAFLRQEIANPAAVDDLVAAVASPEAAMQVYAAARLAIEPDTAEEQSFLAQLATGLGIDQGLAAHIDAEARGLKV